MTRPTPKTGNRVRTKTSPSGTESGSAGGGSKLDSAYLASIVEYSHDGIVLCSLDAIIQSWNVGAQRLFGYTPAEVIGKPIAMLAPEDRRDEPRRTLAALHRSEQVPPYETIRQRKDGSLVDVEVSVIIIMEGSRPVATAAAYRDISKRKRVEEALRLSEERYALVEMATNDGVWDWNPVTHEDYLSPRWKALLGFAEDELHGDDDTFFSRIHPDDVSAVREAIRRHFEERSPYDIELRLRCKDGSHRWFNSRGQAIRDEAGRVIRMLGAITDITGRKQADTALHQSYDLLARLCRQVPGVIYQFQLFPDGRSCVPYASEQIRELYEVTPEDVRNDGSALFAIVHGDDYDGLIASIQESARTLEPWHYEYRVVLPERGVCWRVGDSRPERLSDGSTLWHGFITDTTDRKRVEEALAESERRLKEAQSVGAIGDWQYDIRTGRISWSDALFALFERDPAKGPPRFEENMAYYFPEDSMRLQDHVRRAIESGEGYELDLHLRLPSGRERYHYAIAEVLKDRDGRVVKLYGTAQDITARKQAEDELRKLNSELEKRVAARTASLLSSTESLLLSSAALRKATDERRRLEGEIIEISESERQRIGHDLHDDLGQQLAGLSWLSSVLEKNLHAQSSPEAGGAARIAELLGNALNLTRSLARGLQPVPAESGGLMAALAGLAARSSELFKIGCRFSCRQPVHFRNPNAATHLYRIAQEAVTNAVRHGRAGQVRITLSSSRGRLLLSVADDGEGWKNPDPAHEGLGVRIMHYRAETLGGTLAFHQKPGGGTRVACTIPVPADGSGNNAKKNDG